MKLSLSSHLFVYSELNSQSLQAIANSGIKDLELWLAEPHVPWREAEELAKFQRQLSDYDLSVASVHLPFYPSVPALVNDNARWSVIDTNASQRQISVANAKQGIAAAASLGAQSAVLHLGWQQDQWTDHSHGWAREAVIEMMACAAENSIKLLLENIISEGTRVSALMQMLDEIDPERRVGICLDLGHANIEGDVAHELITALPRLDHIHLHDNDGIQDSHLCPGSGSINWRQVIDLLQENGFSGFAALELRDYSRGELSPQQLIESNLSSLPDLIKPWLKK
ncbi:MAG: sugar phosphate isomerase/epimerase family protein [Planctomycetota bacterium]|jgi:sugar phosphate isomerase/epimerase|nr:sugar phosphate isomerase/epimerase family protein [Planctomycetota bacterium]